MTSFSEFAVGEPTADLGGDRQRRARQRRRRRRPDPHLSRDGQQRRTLGCHRGRPHRHLADRLQPGHDQPVAGQLRPDRRRSRLQLRPGHDRRRRQRHRQPRLHRPGQHWRRSPDRDRQRRPAPSSTPTRPTTARPTRRRSSRSPTSTVAKDDGQDGGRRRHRRLRLHDHGHQRGAVRRRRAGDQRPGPGGPDGRCPDADLGGDCSASSGNTISCSLPASLAPGATWTISVPYAVAASASPATVINSVTATSDENPLGVDATDSDRHRDLGRPRGRRRRRGRQRRRRRRPDPQLLVTVNNGGPSDATAVTLTDTWPTGFSQGAISPSQGTCAPIGAGPDFSCAWARSPAGASATVSVDYTVPASTAAGPQTNTVSVTSAVVDPIPADDSASDTTRSSRSRRDADPERERVAGDRLAATGLDRPWWNHRDSGHRLHGWPASRC